MKKDMTRYYPAALIMYLNYFLHGFGCMVLGQQAIKEFLSNNWYGDVTPEHIATIGAVSAALGLGRLISLPISGPLSDKLGRRVSIIIGGASYAIYLFGVAFAPSYGVAYVCAIVGGLANSFLDTGIYPAVAEIVYQAPGVATMGIKFFIAIAQLLMGVYMTSAVANGVQNFTSLFLIVGVGYIVLFVLMFFMPMPKDEAKNGEKAPGLIENIKKTHFSIESFAMILIGLTSTATFQLWANYGQTFAKSVAGMENTGSMQTLYSAGTIGALIVTSLLTRFVKDVRFILVYPAICLVTLISVIMIPTQTVCVAAAFVIGWAGAGGLLQIATSVCNMIFPKIKGTVTALVMIASSLSNYTLMTAASTNGDPSFAIKMNIVVTGVGVLLGLFVNLRYAKLVEGTEE